MSKKQLITRDDYVSWKKRGEKIVMLTAYDSAFAGIMERSGAIDVILVGDTLGMVFQGRTDTRGVKIEHMRYHIEIVARTAPSIPIIGDMPFHTYDTPGQALENARLLMDAGADGVKLEGNQPDVVAEITNAGIPLMGHLGLLPQTATEYRVQGKGEAAAEKLMQDALELERNGVTSVVLECVPRSLAAEISRSLSIPTIGIGGGPECDGQVLVTNDMLGLTHGHLARFVKQYIQLNEIIGDALSSYADEVRKGIFPTDSHSYH